MTPAIRKPLDNFDFAIPGRTAVVRWMVAVVLVHLAECRNSLYIPGVWPQQVIGLQVKKTSRLDIFPKFFPSLYLDTSMLWYRSLSCQSATYSTVSVLEVI